jgi:hypothetical protein
MRELKTRDDVYETFGGMLRFIATDAACEPWLSQIDATWRFSLTDPEAEITCVFPATGLARIELGRSQLTADTTIEMSTNDASAFLLGELNGFVEIDQGRIGIVGPPVSFLRSIPRIQRVLASVYREVLQADSAPRWLLRSSHRRNGEA